jgi:membrane fusion protein (multidrug efflux system)
MYGATQPSDTLNSTDTVFASMRNTLTVRLAGLVPCQPSRLSPTLSWATLALSLLLSACSDDSLPGAQGFSPPALQVRVAPAVAASYQGKLQVVGSTQSDETVDITSTVTETIKAIHFEDGQKVQAGDPLVTLSQSAEAALRDQVRLSFEDQQRELKRLQGLRASNSVSQTEFDRQETAARVAELRLLEVEAQISDRTIRAPFDGTVGLRELSTGALVSPGVRITTLDKTDPLKIDFRVPATQLDKVRIGAKIEARATHGSLAFQGTIVALDSRVTAESRTIEVRALLPNPEGRLLPGMLVRVTLFGEAVPAQQIPEQAVLQVGSAHYVFLVGDDNVVAQREIALLGREPGRVFISDGLEAGDRVVVEGTHRLRNGQKIAIKGAAPDGGAAGKSADSTDQATPPDNIPG